MIKDSGSRTAFESGAVRDYNPSDKGKPSLMPLLVVGGWLQDTMFCKFDTLVECMENNDWENAIIAINDLQKKFRTKAYADRTSFVIALSRHYFLGCQKYSKNNWKKGISWDSFVDSAIRHYVRWLDGYDDEDHAAAFLWNLSALEWSILNGVYYNEVENDAG